MLDVPGVSVVLLRIPCDRSQGSVRGGLGIPYVGTLGRLVVFAWYGNAKLQCFGMQKCQWPFFGLGQTTRSSNGDQNRNGLTSLSKAQIALLEPESFRFWLSEIAETRDPPPPCFRHDGAIITRAIFGFPSVFSASGCIPPTADAFEAA